MSRIDSCFERLKTEKRKALIPYITAGDPHPSWTVAMMHNLVDAGADVIELGMPFSDPVADGPVIQAAHERALAESTTLTDVLAAVKLFRTKDNETPIVLMGYLNPIEIVGYNFFAKACSDVGVDGVLLVDLPPEESEEAIVIWEQHGLDPIYLVAPTTLDDRMEQICQLDKGYVYYISLKGLTGAASFDLATVEQKLAQLRTHTELPLCVGFGINNADRAAEVAAIADGVIVGSALVSKIEENQKDLDECLSVTKKFIQSLREGMDQRTI